MKTLFFIGAFLGAISGNRETIWWMDGLYLRIPSTFATSMYGVRSEVDTTVVFTYGVTKTHDTVCAAWLYPMYPVQFETIPFDTVTLNINDF